jgi:hypothetical protein
MPNFEPNLWWQIAYWIVGGGSTVLVLLASLILAVQWLQDSRPPPEPDRSEIRHRLQQLPKPPK